MGLDMYLKASLYTNKDYYKPDLNAKLRKLIPEVLETNNLNTIELKVEVGYWRKANQIHKWFVNNVQDGEDSCLEYFVSRNQLLDLRNLCHTVINNSVLEESSEDTTDYNKGGCCEKKPPKKIKDSSVARNLLPSHPGFFFGSYEYNEYYIQDLKDTIDIIDRCLELPDEYDFYYMASW